MYVYERYNFRMVTLLLVIMVVMFIAYAQYAGALIAAVLAVLLAFSYQGIRIDAERKRYIRYDRFLWLQIGRWHDLPPPTYVTLVRINLSSMRNLPSPLILPDNKKGAKAYKVNLVVDHDMRFIPVCRGSLEAMKEEAIALGKILSIRVLDYSTHDKHWIL